MRVKLEKCVSSPSERWYSNFGQYLIQSSGTKSTIQWRFLILLKTHMNTALTVWSISAGGRPNSCSLTADLRDWCYSESHISLQVYSCEEALSQITPNDERPDLILINTKRRGDFSREMLQNVVGSYPLSLILEITGEWCIGDTRSGDPLPIACRFDTTVALQRLQSMLASRQQFFEMRAALNPVASSSELSSFWNRNNLSAPCKRVILVLRSFIE